MNDIRAYFSEISLSFDKIDYLKFLLNLVITALISVGLSMFYVHFGNAASNRKRFAKNFLPLAMTTMMIIFIVKSSLELSLGLVGALSIVRFRSAIKEPEELTFLFLTIGIGLACGANQPMIAVIATLIILTILFIQGLVAGKGIFKSGNHMHLNISANGAELAKLTEILSGSFSFVELRRMDQDGEKADFSFVINASKVDQIELVTKSIKTLYPDAIISFLEQRNITQ